MLAELTAAGGKAILFIDDIHGITGPNAQQGGGVMDASVLLKPLLARCGLHGSTLQLLTCMQIVVCSCRLMPVTVLCWLSKLVLESDLLYNLILLFCNSHRGEVRVVGCTSQDKYRKFIEKDPGLERRFQTVGVDAPGVHETLRILRGLRHK